MAIQIPNPGTGNGATGDNEFVLWSKVKDNFSNTSHAANKLVGEGANNVMPVGAFGLGGYAKLNPENDTLTDFEKSGFYRHNNASAQKPAYGLSGDLSLFMSGSSMIIGQLNISYEQGGRLGFRISTDGVNATWREVYHTSNVTRDSNGFLKAASPIVKVFADKIELNDDAESQDVTFIKNGVGDYTITTTSGLSTDGWYIELPKDINGNPKVAIGTLDDTDGVITLKTYVRIFDMTTFKFVPDLDQPLDIPDGRWIDLRFNNLPIEDDTQTEV